MARPPDSARRRDQSDDDAALRWDDLDDPSYVDPGRANPSDARLGSADAEPDAPDHVDPEGVPEGSRHGGARVEQGDSGVGAARSEHPATKAAAFAVTALGALVFAAYSVAWVIGVGSLPLSGPTLLIEVLYQFAEFLAIIASALWFGATVALTRGRTGVRAAWFALGTLVLLPWPFVFGVIG